jgi:XRE family transcriptional regulator, regulator of sulfur utilization
MVQQRAGSEALDAVAVGRGVRRQRERRGLTLEALGRLAQVSPSMLSAIERGRKVPTVLVLDRIATALDTSIGRVLGEQRDDRVIVIRRDEQSVAFDASGWERRVLSPVLPGVEFEFMRTTLDRGVDAGAFAAHAPGSREYVAVAFGALRLTLDGIVHVLDAGDAIYYAGDCVHAFANMSDAERCEYYLVMELAGHDHRASDGGRGERRA